MTDKQKRMLSGRNGPAREELGACGGKWNKYGAVQ